jgi:hypothetical protein
VVASSVKKPLNMGVSLRGVVAAQSFCLFWIFTQNFGARFETSSLKSLSDLFGLSRGTVNSDDATIKADGMAI